MLGFRAPLSSMDSSLGWSQLKVQGKDHLDIELCILGRPPSRLVPNALRTPLCLSFAQEECMVFATLRLGLQNGYQLEHSLAIPRSVGAEAACQNPRVSVHMVSFPMFTGAIKLQSFAFSDLQDVSFLSTYLCYQASPVMHHPLHCLFKVTVIIRTSTHLWSIGEPE